MAKKNELNIGSRLGDLRKRKQMTLDQLSSKSGVSKSILSQIERNISNPTVSTMMRIADALEETLSGFFMNIDEGKSSPIETSKETPNISSKDGLCELSILGAGETVSWLQWYVLTMKPKGLSQIERNISNPTVSTMMRIADALEETLSGFFMNIDEGKSSPIETSKETPNISSKDGLCELSILGAGETVSWLQWYVLTMKPKGKLPSKSHGSNTFENITVISGEVVVYLKKQSETLKAGDTFRFPTNQEHTLMNKSKTISKVLMVNYIDPINGSFN